jgi:hypothetical protein
MIDFYICFTPAIHDWSLIAVLDLIPGGRGTNWYPKLMMNSNQRR